MGAICNRNLGLEKGNEMWIFTTSGFVSAVRGPNDRTIIVRSRDRTSLLPISKRVNVEIKKTPSADYPYRIAVGHEQFVAWIMNEANDISYYNFKNEVALVRGKVFAKSLSKVWSTMHEVEDVESRNITKE
jgi:hypothetical protein